MVMPFGIFGALWKPGVNCLLADCNETLLRKTRGILLVHLLYLNIPLILRADLAGVIIKILIFSWCERVFIFL